MSTYSHSNLHVYSHSTKSNFTNITATANVATAATDDGDHDDYLHHYPQVHNEDKSYHQRHPHQPASHQSLSFFASPPSPSPATSASSHRAQQVHLSTAERTTCHSPKTELRVSSLLHPSAKNTSLFTFATCSMDLLSSCNLSRSRHLLSHCPYSSFILSSSLSSPSVSASSGSSVHLTSSPSASSPSPTSTSSPSSSSSSDESKSESSDLLGRAYYYPYTSPPPRRTSASLEPLAIKNQIFTREGTLYPSAGTKHPSPAISNCSSEVEVERRTMNSTINRQRNCKSNPNLNIEDSHFNSKSQLDERQVQVNNRFNENVAIISRTGTCGNRHISNSSCSVSWFTYLIVILALLSLPNSIDSCGPGRGGNRRRSPRKLTPLVFKQHVPNVRENTITASGFPEGAISRENPRFKDLVPNYNQDILFKDEEGTGADRLMTRRLKEKLNTLAISVMNHWPGVRLRVTEGWDEERQHSVESLHYEGRAVDITTSDRDRRKYGMLARLAVEAGFDWVYYESRYHIHCSVKSEKADSSRAGGCFDGSSTVITRSGRVKVSELKIGEQVLTVDSESNKTVFSPVIMFMDRDPNRTHEFFSLITRSGRQLTLTGSHLVYVKEDGENGNESMSQERVSFARQVIPGQWLRVLDATVGQVTFEQVVDVRIESKTGAFAPLTETGNLLVNQVLASCYANINDQWLAHASFLPVRISASLLRLIPGSSERRADEEPPPNGIHWYPRLLKWFADRLLPARFVD